MANLKKPQLANKCLRTDNRYGVSHPAWLMSKYGIINHSIVSRLENTIIFLYPSLALRGER